MAFCSNCGAQAENGAKFCAICGQPIPVAAAQEPAPQYQPPQYQQPPYQAPQYQQPQYQAPPYQQPAYQAPQYQQPSSQSQPYQYNPYQPAPQANASGAKKTAVTALIFCGAAVVLYIAAMVASRIAYNSMSAMVTTPVSVYITQFIKFGLCAIFPFLAMRAAAIGNVQSAKGVRTGTTIYLVVQGLMVLAKLIVAIAMRFMGGINANIGSAVSAISSYIAGSNLLSDLLYLNIRSPFFASSLLHFLSAAACIVVTILTLSAAGKMKKA